MALPTFQDMLALTNPTGVSLNGSGPIAGTTTQSAPSGTSGVSNFYGGTGYAGTPIYGTPGTDATTVTNPAPVYYDSAGNTYTTQADATAASQSLAQYDQGISNVQSGIDRLGNQLNVGDQNIDSGYNSALNTLLQAKANNQQQYDTSTTQGKQDYLTAKNTIGSNAGNSLNGLQRLLGSRGAGGSSAALFGAPLAVGQQAAQQRSGAGQTFGRNQQALDTTFNNYLTGEKNSESDLGNQRTNSRNSLQAQIDTTRANLLQSLATLQGQKAAIGGGNPVTAAQPYLDQANGLLSSADSLGLQVPTYQTQPAVYNAPSLDHYTTNPFAAPQSTSNGAVDQSVSPYLSLLLGGLKDKNLQSNLGL